MTSPVEPDDIKNDPTYRAYNCAQMLIDCVNEAGLSLLVDIPQRQLVTTGQAAYDCDQVSATLISLQTGIPGDDTGAAGMPTAFDCAGGWSVIIELAIVRCGLMPDKRGNISIDDIRAAAKQSSRDSAVFDEALRLFADSSISLVRAAISYQEPQGGAIGTTMRITAALP